MSTTGKKTIKNTNIRRLNNTLLNNQQITEEIKKEIKIFIEMNENENTTTQNLWDTVKAVLRGRFIAIQAYFKKQEKSQINNLTLHLKQLEKEEMKNPRVSRRKEILKTRVEINAKDSSLIPGSGRSPGEGSSNPLQYSCLEIPRTEDPGGLQSMGSQRVGHD